jgi:uncharacterized protein (DUF1778 family)
MAVSGRRRPHSVGTRVTQKEKAFVQAAAASEGVPVAEFIHRVVMAGTEETLSTEVSPPATERGNIAGTGLEKAR